MTDTQELDELQEAAENSWRMRAILAEQRADALQKEMKALNRKVTELLRKVDTLTQTIASIEGLRDKSKNDPSPWKSPYERNPWRGDSYWDEKRYYTSGPHPTTDYRS